jgi:hypothetical protein
MKGSSNAGRILPAWFLGAFWLAIAAVTAWAGVELLASDEPWHAVLVLPVLLAWYQLRGEFFARRAVEGHA